MASHLSVITSTTAGISTSRGLSASAAIEADVGLAGIGDVFAALLGGGASAPAPNATASSEMHAEVKLGNLVDLSFGFGADGGSSDAEEPEAIAAVVEAQVPLTKVAIDAPKLTELVEGLTVLKASLDAGEPLDPELLKRIDALLADIGKSIPVEMDANLALDALTALLGDVLPEGGAPAEIGFSTQLTTALAPLAQNMLDGTAAADAGTELGEAIASVGRKLAGLLDAINKGGLSQEQLASLGLQVNADGEAEVDVDLRAALQRLLDATAELDIGVAAPVLAKPVLKLTEPVLAGRAAAEVAAEVGILPAEPADAGTATEGPEVVPTRASVEKPAAGNIVLETAETATDVNAEIAIDPASSDAKPDAKLDLKADAKGVVAATAGIATDPKADPAAMPQQPAQPALRVDAAFAARTVLPGYQTSQQQLNLPQIAFELVRQVNDGNTRFQIRLDPAELGKIDVNMTIDSSGQVNARLIVEKSETLDLMQRDQRALERALQQAGLDSGKTSLEFSLKQNPFAGGGQQGHGRDGQQAAFGARFSASAEEAQAPAPTVNLYRGSLSASGVNIIA